MVLVVTGLKSAFTCHLLNGSRQRKRRQRPKGSGLFRRIEALVEAPWYGDTQGPDNDTSEKAELKLDVLRLERCQSFELGCLRRPMPPRLFPSFRNNKCLTSGCDTVRSLPRFLVPELSR